MRDLLLEKFKRGGRPTGKGFSIAQKVRLDPARLPVRPEGYTKKELAEFFCTTVNSIGCWLSELRYAEFGNYSLKGYQVTKDKGFDNVCLYQITKKK